MKIAVIKYNAGNIASVTNALERFGYEYVITKDPKEILAADKVIFPGQGRAGPAMKSLRESGLDTVLPRIKKPFLGICLGMQLLFESSEEDATDCLAVIPGRVKKFTEPGMKVPQMGWNTMRISGPDPLLEGLPRELFAYFANSFYAEVGSCVLASGTYGNTPFAAIVRKDNFFGTQFHPEKSGVLGERVLENFLRL